MLMVVFHAGYDLAEYGGVQLDYRGPLWTGLGLVTGLLFMFVSGISSVVGNRAITRGIQVFLAGMVITVVTYVAFPEEYVRFGILHYLGVAMIIGGFLKRRKLRTVWAALAVSVILSLVLPGLTAKTPLLLPLGIEYPGLNTLDYYPIFPFLPVTLAGVLTGRLFYAGKKSLFGFELDSKVVRFISRNSLWIYLLHQPVLIGVVLLW